MDPEIPEWSSRLSQSHLWRGRLVPFPLSFHRIDLVWGPHSIDRFANHLNAKLPRFNSRFSNPGAEGIDAFVMVGLGKITMFVRPSALFCACCFICIIAKLQGYGLHVHSWCHARFGMLPHSALRKEKIHVLNEKKCHTVNHFLNIFFYGLPCFCGITRGHKCKC